MFKRNNYKVTIASNTEKQIKKVNCKTPMNAVLYIAKWLIKCNDSIIDKVKWIQIEKLKED